MKKILVLTAMAVSLTTLSANDIIIKKSSYSVDNTVNKIKTILEKKGLTVFTVIDHQSNAKKAGLKMDQSKVIIFGNPKVGTKLMNQDILTSLDLPMKIAIYEDNYHGTKIAYRNASWLEKEHKITTKKLIAKVNGALDKITTKAGSNRAIDNK